MLALRCSKFATQSKQPRSMYTASTKPGADQMQGPATTVMNVLHRAPCVCAVLSWRNRWKLISVSKKGSEFVEFILFLKLNKLSESCNRTSIGALLHRPGGMLLDDDPLGIWNFM